MVDINKLIREAEQENQITCPKCDNSLELDQESCYCGWINPLPELGFI